jgi:hypothetical protein
MPRYLVETYIPRSRAGEARAAGRRITAIAEELSREGTPVRYIRTTFLPDDETCFHSFEAVSANAVEEVSRRAKLGRARVVRALESSRPAPRHERNEHAQDAFDDPWA